MTLMSMGQKQGWMKVLVSCEPGQGHQTVPLSVKKKKIKNSSSQSQVSFESVTEKAVKMILTLL
jgi:hypothetical protein